MVLVMHIIPQKHSGYKTKFSVAGYIALVLILIALLGEAVISGMAIQGVRKVLEITIHQSYTAFILFVLSYPFMWPHVLNYIL